jgi:hypothetical protein
MVNREVKKQLYVGRIIISLIISFFLFIGVFSFGYFIAFENYKSIVAEQDQIYNSLISLQLEKELMQTSCENLDLTEFSTELNNMGSFMGELEKKLGKNNPDVIEQKKVFTMLQVQHYLLIKENNENCQEQFPIILFFYSNQDKNIDQAELSGYILSTFRITNPDTMLYSLDYDLDSNLVRTLKRINGITEPNSILVRNNVITNVKNIDQIQEAYNNPELQLHPSQVITLN